MNAQNTHIYKLWNITHTQSGMTHKKSKCPLRFKMYEMRTNEAVFGKLVWPGM